MANKGKSSFDFAKYIVGYISKFPNNPLAIYPHPTPKNPTFPHTKMRITLRHGNLFALRICLSGGIY